VEYELLGDGLTEVPGGWRTRSWGRTVVPWHGTGDTKYTVWPGSQQRASLARTLWGGCISGIHGRGFPVSRASGGRHECLPQGLEEAPDWIVLSVGGQVRAVSGQSEGTIGSDSGCFGV
jgi:hypothetical protein